MRILVCQYHTSNLQYPKYSREINQKYCDMNGYDYYVEDEDEKIIPVCMEEGVAFQWYKVFLLKKLLRERPEYDWYLFVDMDAIFISENERIENFLDNSYNLMLADDVGHHSLFNTGVIFAKNTEWTANFLEKWWNSKSEIDGKSVNAVLSWEGGMGQPDNKEVFKGSLWHEQTCLSYLARTDEEVRNNIKKLPKEVINSPVYRQGSFIFHAFSYGYTPLRALDRIQEVKSCVFENKKTVSVVYFIYCKNDYLTLVKSDLIRIKASGLYDDLNNLHLVLSIPEEGDLAPYEAIEELIGNDSRVTIHTSYRNTYEHEGITRAWIEAHKSDGYTLYFHTKGITASYSGKTEHSDWKKQGDLSFIEMLKFFMIDNYKHCLHKLEQYDIVNVSDSYSRGWPSGNFWWATNKFIRENNLPLESYYDRWASEAWISAKRENYKCFQVYERFGYRDKFTYLPERSFKEPQYYDNKKIELLSAKLVTLMEPENENDRNRPDTPHEVDFTEFVQQNLDKNEGKGFDNIRVSFHTLGRTIEDPCYGVLKSLVIEFRIEGEDTVYRLVGDEGQTLNFYINSYTSVGYRYRNNYKNIIELHTVLSSLNTPFTWI